MNLYNRKNKKCLNITNSPIKLYQINTNSIMKKIGMMLKFHFKDRNIIMFFINNLLIFLLK
jgi:hypothetical protein